MCTLVILRRPWDDTALVVGANRDEMRDRPWRPPGRHWPERPRTVAGLDELGGGSWMGINDDGVVAAILNREGALGPAPGKRSRGELVLHALDHRRAADAARAAARLDAAAYRPFNMLVADGRDAFLIAHRGKATLAPETVPAGLSMLTVGELDDPSAPRIARYRERFATATPPTLGGDDDAWRALLTDTETDPALGPQSAMRFTLPTGFATLCSSILVLPAPTLGRAPRWTFAGTDDTWDWAPVTWNARTKARDEEDLREPT